MRHCDSATDLAAPPLRDALASRLGFEPMVRAAWLFGSCARGVARPDSDINVAVLG